MIFSLYNGRVSQAIQADGTHPLAGKGKSLPGHPISQTLTPQHRPVLLINRPGAPQRDTVLQYDYTIELFSLSIDT
jgi:hypothetical protein